MRKRAQDAGTLKTTTEQTVTTKEQTIIIEPANPEIVYLPAYSPWIAYGAPLLAYPGYLNAGFFVGPAFWFSGGYPIGPWHRHHHWGWHRWGFNWRDRHVVFNHNRYISRSHTFIHRRGGSRFGGGFRGHENDFRGRAEGNRASPFDHRAGRGFVAPHVERGGHPGTFRGCDHGGVANRHSFRGQSSFRGGMHGGGVGGMRSGGGGGMRGGGGGRR